MFDAQLTHVISPSCLFFATSLLIKFWITLFFTFARRVRVVFSFVMPVVYGSAVLLLIGYYFAVASRHAAAVPLAIAYRIAFGVACALSIVSGMSVTFALVADIKKREQVFADTWNEQQQSAATMVRRHRVVAVVLSASAILVLVILGVSLFGVVNVSHAEGFVARNIMTLVAVFGISMTITVGVHPSCALGVPACDLLQRPQDVVLEALEQSSTIEQVKLAS